MQTWWAYETFQNIKILLTPNIWTACAFLYYIKYINKVPCQAWNTPFQRCKLCHFCTTSVTKLNYKNDDSFQTGSPTPKLAPLVELHAISGPSGLLKHTKIPFGVGIDADISHLTFNSPLHFKVFHDQDCGNPVGLWEYSGLFTALIIISTAWLSQSRDVCLFHASNILHASHACVKISTCNKSQHYSVL